MASVAGRRLRPAHTPATCCSYSRKARNSGGCQPLVSKLASDGPSSAEAQLLCVSSGTWDAAAHDKLSSPTSARNSASSVLSKACGPTACRALARVAANVSARCSSNCGTRQACLAPSSCGTTRHQRSPTTSAQSQRWASMLARQAASRAGSWFGSIRSAARAAASAAPGLFACSAACACAIRAPSE
ncbi:MAG: hypothetical protein Q8R69_09285 [Telluria sp.]|nr:hypothetical protein [Telluria sp.]